MKYAPCRRVDVRFYARDPEEIYVWRIRPWIVRKNKTELRSSLDQATRVGDGLDELVPGKKTSLDGHLWQPGTNVETPVAALKMNSREAVRRPEPSGDHRTFSRHHCNSADADSNAIQSDIICDSLRTYGVIQILLHSCITSIVLIKYSWLLLMFNIILSFNKSEIKHKA